jgi:site-specific recombinase XerD
MTLLTPSELSPARLDEKRLSGFESEAPLRGFVRSWIRSLRARNRSERTITSYVEAVTMLDRFLREKGMPRTAEGIRREHIEDFLAHHAETRSPATALTRYHALRAFFRWLVEDAEELQRSPMEKMKAAKTEPPVMRVLSIDELDAILATCAKGKTFDERRDYAILSLLMYAGLRRNELAELTLDDLDLDRAEIVIEHAKGGRPRVLRIEDAMPALERYLRVRDRHPKAYVRGVPERRLFLGKMGPIKRGGVAFIVDRRVRQAGISKPEQVHPHTFRHSWAHHWLASGGSEGDLMRNAGWTSRDMPDRYGSSMAGERAREASSRFGVAALLRARR